MSSTCWCTGCARRSIRIARGCIPFAEPAMFSALPDEEGEAPPADAQQAKTPKVRAVSGAGTRLTLLDAVIFTLGVGGLFALAYFLIARTVERTDREVLVSKLNEYSAIYQAGGVLALKAAVDREKRGGQLESLFVRL